MSRRISLEKLSATADNLLQSKSCIVQTVSFVAVTTSPSSILASPVPVSRVIFISFISITEETTFHAALFKFVVRRWTFHNDNHPYNRIHTFHATSHPAPAPDIDLILGLSIEATFLRDIL